MIQARRDHPADPLVLVPLLDTANGGLPEIRAWCDAAGRHDAFRFRAFERRRDLLRHRTIFYVYFPEWLVRSSVTQEAGISIWSTLFALRIAKSRGTKIVWHGNNLLPHEIDKRGLVDRFMQSFSGLVDAFIGSSQSSVDEFVERYPRLRAAETWVIPQGNYRAFYQPPNRDTEDLRSDLGIEPHHRLGLSVGMMRKYKNQLALIEAFRTVPDANARLALVGTAPDSGYLQRLIRAAEGDSRVLIRDGYLSDQTLANWITAADFTVLPAPRSLKSGTAMLSLSFNRPVVVPHRGEFIDWADDLGPDWVQTFDGGIRHSILKEAFGRHRRSDEIAPLEKYNWDDGGRALAECFRSMMEN